MDLSQLHGVVCLPGHWSVERHIRRKHSGIGEPISINTHQTRTQMNIPSGWSSFSAPTNTTQFSRETNKLQRDSNTITIAIITLRVTIMLEHLIKQIQKTILSLLPLQAILTMKKQEEDSYLDILKIGE